MASYLKISRLREFLEEILKILYYYRGRVVFSFSGVALGILAIVIIITAIDGANRRAYEIFDRLGPDAIMVFSGGERQRSARERFDTLTVEDAAAMMNVEGMYDMVKVLATRGMNLAYQGRKWQTMVVGTTANYFDSMSWNLAEGSVFTERDANEAEPVCVIGYKVWVELFQGKSAVGKTIRVGRVPTRVLGVLEERGGSAGGPQVDDRLIMPITTVMGKIKNEKRYLTFVRLRTARDPDETIKDVKTLLALNHGYENADDYFTIRSSKDVLKFMSVITGSLFLFLGTAAVVALVVSGFVLANLFYITIQERRKDIGIRRAYGATRKGILLSFLVESVIITLLGGAAGLVLAFALGGTFEKLFKLPMVFSFKAVAFALLFSFATGVLAGLRPAFKASRIEPIEAIRG